MVDISNVLQLDGAGRRNRRARRRLATGIQFRLPLHLRLRCWLHHHGPEMAVALTFAGLIGVGLTSSNWDSLTTLRHWAAAPSCTSAGAVGLAPASRGQPGYYSSHDTDNNGISCEADPQIRIASQ